MPILSRQAAPRRCVTAARVPSWRLVLLLCALAAALVPGAARAQLSVFPANSTLTVPVNKDTTFAFTAVNQSGSTTSYSLTVPTCTGAVMTCAVTPTFAANVANYGSIAATASFKGKSTPGTGTVVVRVSNAGGTVTRDLTLTVNVVVPPPSRHAGAPAAAPPMKVLGPATYTATAGETRSGTSYADQTGTQLRDSVVGGNGPVDNFGSGAGYEWVGWQTDPTINLTFTRPVHVTRVRIGFLRRDTAGIGVPQTVRINGTVFTQTGSEIADGTGGFVTFAGSWTLPCTSGLGGSCTALQVKLEDPDWILADEIQVEGYEGPHAGPVSAPEFATVESVSYTAPAGGTGAFRYLDETGRQLADGVLGSNSHLDDLGSGQAYEWVGWNAPVTLRVTLPGERNLEQVQLSFLRKDSAGIRLPQSVTINGTEVAVSETTLADGRGGFIAFPLLDGAREVEIVLTPRPGSWILTDELQVAASAYSAFTTGDGMAPVVALDSATSLPFRDPSLCVTVALGAGAAECGDLRLVHALPATRTLGKTRAPTLLYNSQQADPAPVVAFDVSVPAESAVPTELTAALVINGVTYTQTFADRWPAGQSRRLLMQPAALGALATGVYPYTLQVTAHFEDATSFASATKTGSLVVVNRKAHGGWWVAGVEQLSFPTANDLLWVGGDGSVRVYHQSTSTLWTAPVLDGPDEIVKETVAAVGAGQFYVRRLRGGVKVVFDLTGKHVATVNRLGHVTRFTYQTNGFPASISVPVLSGTQPLYTFARSGSQMTITAPAVTTPEGVVWTRVTTLAYDGSGRVTSITEPDGRQVGFLYQEPGTTFRVTTRNDRLQHPVRFSYDAARKVAGSTTVMADTTQNVRLALAPNESRGAGGAALTGRENAYTLIDGPRPDTEVLDHTRLYVNGFGAPWKTRNALGETTAAYYEDARFPILATRMVLVNGMETRAMYNARGNLDSTVSVNPYGTNLNAVTRYRYEDAAWPDFVTRVTAPTGEYTVTAYDASTGNRTYMEDARGTASRARFTYSAGLLASVQLPVNYAAGANPEQYAYDPVSGNLTTVTSPLGFVTQSFQDAVGRDTAVVTPIDATRTGRQTIRYSRAGRDSIAYTYGDVAEGDLKVETVYDAEGRRVSVVRSLIDGPPDNPGTYIAHNLVLTHAWTYDWAGRVVTESPGSGTDVFAYDAAGNLRTHNRRESGDVLRMDYDILGRLTRRMMDAKRVEPELHWQLNGPTWTSIPYPTQDSAYVIPGDTARFAYDALGNMTLAANRDAVVSREYYRGGALLRETQQLRASAVPNDATFSTYVLEYEYDLSGRRKKLTLPSTLAPSAGNAILYGYDAQTGDLQTVTSPFGHVSTYEYDADGRVDRILRPGTVIDDNNFDADGRLTRRRVTLGGYNAASDTMQYDRRGKMTRVDYGAGSSVGVKWFEYSRIGSLRVERSGDQAGPVHGTAYVVDAFANRMKKYDEWTQDTTYYDYDPGGRLFRERQWTYVTGTNYGANSVNAYTTPGDLRQVTRNDGMEKQYTWTNNLYGRDGRLRVANVQRCAIVYDQVGNQVNCRTQNLTPSTAGAWEEYRYDALGRRVSVLLRRQPTCSNCRPPSYTRTIWDGDQVLGEIRSDESGVIGGGDAYGRVLNVHGEGIDNPLQIIRLDAPSTTTDGARTLNLTAWGGAVPVTPMADFAGAYFTGVTPDGQEVPCRGGGCHLVDWPSADRDAFSARAAQPTEYAWFGGLIDGQRSPVGTQYMRSRYYDPATGRFTQEDPIGLAGGMNAYGFAEGDPVSFSDPYGLCPGCRMSADGLRWLRREEALRTRVYDDGVGNPTIGYGHLIRPGENFSQGITAGQAEELFRRDVAAIVDPYLDRITVNLNQNQVDAIGAFIFNAGPGTFSKYVLPHLNRGDFAAATAQMATIVTGRNQATGERRVLPGLVRRRREEIEMFYRREIRSGGCHWRTGPCMDP